MYGQQSSYGRDPFSTQHSSPNMRASAPPTGANRKSGTSSHRSRPLSSPGFTNESVRSTDTTKSDPGPGSQYQSSTPGVCIDEKVLKQISDNQTKFMQERITSVEEHFGNLCDGFAAYARGIAKLRDKGDAVAVTMTAYANQERLNPGTQDALLNFGELFSAVQDYRETEVRRIEEKVVRPLMGYGTSCKQAKERMKVACAVRKKELDQKKALERSRDGNPFNNRRIMKAQAELQKTSLNASQAVNDVEQEMEKFEEIKLQDTKQLVKDFVTIEMLFHAKALELFSECYQSLENLNEEADLAHFRNSLRPMTSQSRLTAQRALADNATPQLGTRSTLMSTITSDTSSVDGRPPRPAGRQGTSRGTAHQKNGQQAKSQRSSKGVEGEDDLESVGEDQENSVDEGEDEEQEEEDDDEEDEDEEDSEEDETDEESEAGQPQVQMRPKQAVTTNRR